MNRQTIYVAGHPKSGTTWLTWLLGDALNCPTGSAWPEADVSDFVTEGYDRPAPYIVRRGHFALVDDVDVPPVSKTHKLAWRNITDERVVYIHRDPRDIAVSTAHYWKRDLDTCISDLMEVNSQDPHDWHPFTQTWMNATFVHVATSYEKLIANCAMELWRILETLRVDYDDGRIDGAVERQSFHARRKIAREHGDEMVFGKEFNIRFLRKGVVGDWRNHFNREQGRLIQQHLGDVMAALGYTDAPCWWRELPE